MAVFTDIIRPPVGPLQGTPAAGVTITINGLPMLPGDYDFADRAPLEHRELDLAQPVTGTSGAALVGLDPITRDPGTIVGGQSLACSFAQIPMLGLPGTIQLQEITGTCD